MPGRSSNTNDIIRIITNNEDHFVEDDLLELTQENQELLDLYLDFKILHSTNHKSFNSKVGFEKLISKLNLRRTDHA